MINIIWVESCTYQCENGIPKHKHDFFHYIYVDSGMGQIVINDSTFIMSQGYIYLMSPGVEHAFVNTGKVPLKTLEIKFNLDSADQEKALMQFPMCLDVRIYPVKSLLLSIYKENSKKEFLFQQIIKSTFQLILNYLQRCSDNIEHETVKSENYDAEVENVRNYIYENFEKEISLEQLAEIAGFEKNYFLRKFRKETGCTPMNFVQKVRIEKAKDFLRYSDMNVSQIAVATGFKTIHYFSKVFLENCGIRPTDYRNEHSIM